MNIYQLWVTLSQNMESHSIQENLDFVHVWDGNNMISFCISIGIPLECACSHWNSMGIRYPPNFAEETIESIDFRAEVGYIGHDWFAKWRNFTEHVTNHWVNSGLVGWSVNMLGSCLVYYIILLFIKFVVSNPDVRPPLIFIRDQIWRPLWTIYWMGYAFILYNRFTW